MKSRKDPKDFRYSPYSGRPTASKNAPESNDDKPSNTEGEEGKENQGIKRTDSQVSIKSTDLFELTAKGEESYVSRQKKQLESQQPVDPDLAMALSLLSEGKEDEIPSHSSKSEIEAAGPSTNTESKEPKKLGLIGKSHDSSSSNLSSDFDGRPFTLKGRNQDEDDWEENPAEIKSLKAMFGVKKIQVFKRSLKALMDKVSSETKDRHNMVTVLHDMARGSKNLQEYFSSLSEGYDLLKKFIQNQADQSETLSMSLMELLNLLELDV